MLFGDLNLVDILNMSYNNRKLLIFSLFITACVFPLVTSSPIHDSPYDKFIYSLSNNNCIMPKELKLPFSETSDPSPFSYLSAPLKECRTLDVSKEYDEAHMLCTEVFDVLKNITCVKYNESLPVIQTDHLSSNVCHDFGNLKDIFPRNDKYLSARLSDELICKVLCTDEKHELLCKTLLWSYDTLMKIRQALSCEVQENGNINNAPLDKVISSVKPSSTSIELETHSQNAKEPDKSKIVDNSHPDVENSQVSNLKQIDQEPQNSKIYDDHGENISEDIQSKKVSLDPIIQNEVTNKTADITKNLLKVIPQNKSEPVNEKLSPEISENTVKAIEPKTLPDMNPQLDHMDENENKIDVVEKPPPKEANDNTPQSILNTNNLAPNIDKTKESENNKNETADNLLNKVNDKNDINSNGGSKTSVKSEESVTLTAGIDNELKSNFPEEEIKSKTKQIDLEDQEVKEIEKPKQSEYESAPNEILPDNDSKLPESSTQLILPDEDIDHQEDKDEDQYKNSPSKIKESEVKSSISAGSNQLTNGYDNISPQNNLGRISEEIAVIAPFPEQEDGHFFFYFLSIVLIIMAGYLIFHNKQKIIALIVEGRHERRRRSHGAGYKKLETK